MAAVPVEQEPGDRPGGLCYRFVRPGTYLRVSPHGYWFHVDGTGTVDLGRHGPAGDGFGDPPHP